nr:polysaccharide deacetylase family protein [Allomuricauda sp.]
MKYLKYFLVVSFFFAGFNLSSCSDDKELFIQSIIEDDNQDNGNDEDGDGNDGADDDTDNQDSTDDGDQTDDNENPDDPDPDPDDDNPDTGEPPVVDENITVATWKNFADAAISHTWDDSYDQQIEIAVPLFDSYNMNTTLYMLPNKIDNWQPYRNAYQNGHEIASHTMSHPSFDGLDRERVEAELKNSKEIITQNMDYSECHTMAYPFCDTENYNLTEQYYIAARGCQGRVEKSTPDDFMEIAAILCGEGTANFTTTHLNNIAQSAAQENGWAVYLFHMIDGTGGFNISSNTLGQHLQFLDNNGEKYWVDSFLNVVKYIRERNNITVHLLREDASEIAISCTDNLDDNIYNFPITLKKEIPSNWANATAEQASVSMESYILEEAGKKYLVFNVVPDGGDIIIAP